MHRHSILQSVPSFVLFLCVCMCAFVVVVLCRAAPSRVESVSAANASSIPFEFNPTPPDNTTTTTTTQTHHTHMHTCVRYTCFHVHGRCAVWRACMLLLVIESCWRCWAAVEYLKATSSDARRKTHTLTHRERINTHVVCMCECVPLSMCVWVFVRVLCCSIRFPS